VAAIQLFSVGSMQELNGFSHNSNPQSYKVLWKSHENFSCNPAHRPTEGWQKHHLLGRGALCELCGCKNRTRSIS